MSNDSLPLILRRYLEECGIPSSEIARSDLDTRLYHDLHIYGDIANGCMEILQNKYNIDLKGFVFSDYFPEEFPGSNIFYRSLLWLFPWFRDSYDNNHQIRPFTLRMTLHLIETKRWRDLNIAD